MAELTQEQKDFIKAIESLPEVVQGCFTALTLHGHRIVNGATWGIVTAEDLSADPALTAAAEDEQATQVWGISSGMLINVNPALFFEKFGATAPKQASEYYELYNQAKQKAHVELEKRLTKIIKEKQSVTRLAIFSGNASPTATAQDGTRLPAFQLDFNEFSGHLASTLANAGYQGFIQFGSVRVPAGQSLPAGQNIPDALACRDNNAVEVTLYI